MTIQMGLIIVTMASFYTRASCIKESGSAIMANGKELNDRKLTCASWDYPLGTVLEVENISTGKLVRVTVTDRGPSRRLYRMGRKLDLTARAFRKIAPLKQGTVQVRIKALKSGGSKQRRK